MPTHLDGDVGMIASKAAERAWKKVDTPGSSAALETHLSITAVRTRALSST